MAGGVTSKPIATFLILGLFFRVASARGSLSPQRQIVLNPQFLSYAYGNSLDAKVAQTGARLSVGRWR